MTIVREFLYHVGSNTAILKTQLQLRKCFSQHQLHQTWRSQSKNRIFFAVLENTISSETSSHSSKDKNNLKSIHLYVDCTLKQMKSKFNLALLRVVQVPTLRLWNVHCLETAHQPNFQVTVVFIISRDVELYFLYFIER